MRLLWLVFVLGIVAATAAGIGFGGGLGAVVLLVVLLASLFAGVRLLTSETGRFARSAAEEEDRRFLTRLVGIAFVTRLVVSMVIHETDLWFFFGGDEHTFHISGEAFALWIEGVLPTWRVSQYSQSGEWGYPSIVGALYYSFGNIKAIPLFINAAIGACIVLPVHEVAGRWAGRVAARRAALLVAWFPSFILWSSLLVRDVLMLFLLAVAVMAVDRLRRRISADDVVLMAAVLLALLAIRTYIAFIFILAAAAGLVVGRRSVFQSLALGALAMLLFVALTRTTGLGAAEIEQANLAHLAERRMYNAMGPSEHGSLGIVDISTPGKALAYLPLGLLYFFFSPLPWQIASARQIMSIADLVLIYWMLPAWFRGFRYLFRRRRRAVMPLFLCVVGISVLYALVEGNIGILFRHRAQALVLLIIVAGVGHAVKVRRERRRSVEGAVPVDAPPGGALRPAPHLRVPAGAR